MLLASFLGADIVHLGVFSKKPLLNYLIILTKYIALVRLQEWLNRLFKLQ